MARRSESKNTTDHEEIRRWVEERGGHPAAVKRTRGKGDETGILRIDFPGYSGEGSLEPISWEEFFDKFDREGLAFLYQEETARGQKSNFNKIVNRDTVMKRGAKSRGTARKTAARGAPARKRAGATAKKKTAGKSGTAAETSSAQKRATARKTTARKSGSSKSTGRKAAKRGNR